MTDTAVIESLLRLDLLKPVPEESREPIVGLFASVSELRHAAPGETILCEGYLGFGSGYVLLEGDAEIVREGRSPIPLKPPTLLGEMSQFSTKDTRTASVVTTSDAVFIQFDWEELYERAEAELGPRITHLLRAAVERLIFKRFGHPELLTLPLFAGLGDDLAYKVSVVFPWLTERVSFKSGETLFLANTRCQSKGYLVTAGQVHLRNQEGRETRLSAPTILGVMPKNDPKLSWTATATAQEDVTAFVFSWQNYIAALTERLSPEQQQKVVEAFRTNSASLFVN